MHREQYYEAISDLARDPGIAYLALYDAMSRLDLVQLGQLFDLVAEVHRRRHPNQSSYVDDAGRPIRDSLAVVRDLDGNEV